MLAKQTNGHAYMTVIVLTVLYIHAVTVSISFVTYNYTLLILLFLYFECSNIIGSISVLINILID